MWMCTVHFKVSFRSLLGSPAGGTEVSNISMSSNHVLKPCASKCQPVCGLSHITSTWLRFIADSLSGSNVWDLRGASAKKSEDTDWVPHAFHRPSLQAIMYPFPTHVLVVGTVIARGKHTGLPSLPCFIPHMLSSAQATLNNSGLWHRHLNLSRSDP